MEVKTLGLSTVLETAGELVSATRLLLELQQVSAIVQSFSGCQEPEAIARQATDGLIEKFDCAFARLWLMEPDGLGLRLVASSGMYTHTDGFFARVPLGAFKVGKIAQNRISFLSNNLPDEPWVKDRDWAIAHNITGFAGYPLQIGDRVVGVLAVFSHHALSAEFLEVLQGLCTTLALTLENCRQFQQKVQMAPAAITGTASLSEQLAKLLPQARLILLGTERPLPATQNCLLLQAAELLQRMACSYCRLNYSTTHITLEAMVSTAAFESTTTPHELTSPITDLQFAITYSGGTLQSVTTPNQKLMQWIVQIPYAIATPPLSVRVHLTQPVLQMAFTRLAYEAGLTVSQQSDPALPLITDDQTAATDHLRVLWVSHDRSSSPPNASLASLNLAIQPTQLRQAVEAAIADQPWGTPPEPEPDSKKLTARECEILRLLAEGRRDRDIASELFISESTVKFHMNNVSTKLKAKTRYQALYLAIVKGLI